MQADLPLTSKRALPLTFGSIISLSPIENPDSFIFVNGFIKDKVLVKKFDYTDPKLMYSQCLFQIYPSFTNTYKKEAINLRENKVPSRASQAHKKVEMINNIQEKIITEFNFNLETYKKVIGQPIVFGQGVQLLHISSNRFLACRDVESDFEKENYKVNLDEITSDATVFKFHPCYKHQKESEGVIYIDDSVSLVSPNTLVNRWLFIHMSNPTATKIRHDSAHIKMEKHDYNKSKFKVEINASLESQSRFHINFYTNYYSETSSILECADIIWLNHSELNAMLVCVTGAGNSFNQYRIEFDVANNTDINKQFIGNTNGMWIVENAEYKKGGPVRWDESYRFRHLSSGLYLTILTQKKKGKTYSKFVLAKEANEDNVFKFVPVNEGNTTADSVITKSFVTKDTFVLVKHTKSEMVIQASYDQVETIRKSAADDDDNNTGFLLSDTMPITIKHGAGSEEAAFKIMKANYNEVWETNFLISCFPLLTGFLDIISDQNNVYLVIKTSSNLLVEGKC